MANDPIIVSSAEHAQRHAVGGPDEVTPASIGAVDVEQVSGTLTVGETSVPFGPGEEDSVGDALERLASVANLSLDLLGSLLLRGNGQPVGVVSADVGTEYIDLDGTAGARKWYKASGTGTDGWVVTDGDTGWIPLTVGENLDPNGNGTTASQIRRRNDTIFVQFSAVGLEGFASGDTAFYFPEGIEPQRSVTYLTPGYTGPNVTVAGPRGGQYARLHSTGPFGAARYIWTLSANTEIVWPTNLPVTPA